MTVERTLALWYAIDTARRAGSAAMTFFGRPLHVDQKPGAGPVTDADRRSHDIIVSSLSALDAAIPVISEEADTPPYERRQAWQRWWLIDPLDGTKEFIAGIPEFTVNIALIEDGRPVIGVVFAPALQTLYFATPHLGAWRQIGTGPPVRIQSAPAPAATPLRIVESRFHRSTDLDAFLAGLPVAARMQVGSSLKACRLAENAADLYPRLSPIMEWDIAAGDCIFRCSGVIRERFSPLVYNRPDLRFPAFVLGGESLP